MWPQINTQVCRRYKQYHQQVQMVVSSFESVPDLSAATPFATLALRSISKNFRRLKNVISLQLHEISHILGEEPTPSPSSRRGALLGHSRLPYMEHNHPVWRPQRGLPERAVSVLRAWLFDHFLHP
jgi:Associated with HOX